MASLTARGTLTACAQSVPIEFQRYPMRAQRLSTTSQVKEGLLESHTQTLVG